MEKELKHIEKLCDYYNGDIDTVLHLMHFNVTLINTLNSIKIEE